jgi:hypothetical protein
MLPKTAPCVLLRDAAPEERGELVPLVRTAGGERQIGEQRLRLAARHRQGWAVAQPGFETSK